MKTVHLVGAYHADMAWKKGPEEMEELFESFIVRLLDLLEQHPGFTYVLEQAAHFRQMAVDRPDLVKRVKQYVCEGRLEVVGGMATTMETNIPCGESFVMNQLLGLEWFRRNMGVTVSTGWLIDTFGTHAQVPQLLRQSGIRCLMANRFGGEMTKDLFVAVGLDGTRMPTAGRDVFSPFIADSRVFFEFTQNWKSIDSLFDMAEKAGGDGPFLLMPYIENEVLPSKRIALNLEARQAAGGFTWSLPSRFFSDAEKNIKGIPEVFADLNPEFTGTFAQRIAIRLLNRRAEGMLLDAERWAALLQADPEKNREALDGAWWRMAFNHFHDVFTGSHPTEVFNHVVDNFGRVEADARLMLRETLGCGLAEKARPGILTVLNGLPWDRQDVVSIPAGRPGEGYRITRDGVKLPSEVHDGCLRFLADAAATGSAIFLVESAAPAGKAWEQVEQAEIENETIRLSASAEHGVDSLYLKTAGWTALRGAGAMLAAQQDGGNFQFEQPCGSEIPAIAGGASLFRLDSPLGQRIKLAGTMKKLQWASGEDMLDWSVEFFLPKGKARLECRILIGWHAEGVRLRLKIPTTIDSSAGIFEIPFGVVERKPYAPGYNKKGDWPAQRFVAVEDAEFGLALINTGVPGVEVAGGTIWSTLLRAPVSEYAGMSPDETSSQHGLHDFTFVIVPYCGTWHDSAVLQHAGEMNSPMRVLEGPCGVMDPGESLLKLSGGTAVLSSVKLPQDCVPHEIIVRLYETAGRSCTPTLTIRRAAAAWRSSILEERGSRLACEGGTVTPDMGPFEIVTLRIKLADI